MEITVKFEENSCEFDARFYDSAILEPVYITPTGKELVVNPSDSIDGFSQVTVEGDNNLKPENIVSGVTIYGVEGTREDAASVLTPITVVPTGKDYTEYPRFDGFSEVTVAGDVNLEPQNIAEGITIYGVEGTLKIGASSTIPSEYESFIEHAQLLYTGDYANLAIVESNNILNVAFLMDDFKVLSYNESTTEFTAIGWLYCEYTKATQTWRVVNYTTEASTGTNYVKHIRYSSVYWEYGGQVIWPFGASGGGSGLNIAYGDTAPDDTTKLWVKAAEPSRLEIADSVSASLAIVPNVNVTGNNYQYRPAVYDGSVIYLFGGRDSNGNVTDVIQAFDPSANTIETLAATLPKKTGRIAGARVGDKIYLFSGADIYCFDTTSRTITTMSAKMPVSIEGNIAAAVGAKIYTLGGGSSASNISNAICVYDTETNTVTKLSQTLPNNITDAPVSAVGTKVYQFGGYYYSGGWKTSNAIVVYDTEANTVETMSVAFPKQIGAMASEAFGTKVYLFGGTESSNTNTIMVFDTVTKTLGTLEAVLPAADAYLSAELAGGDIYLFSGAAKPDAIHKFSVASVMLYGNMVIVPSATENVFDMISNASTLVKMGVLAVYAGNADNVAELVPAYLHKDGAWTEI